MHSGTSVLPSRDKGRPTSELIEHARVDSEYESREHTKSYKEIRLGSADLGEFHTATPAIITVQAVRRLEELHPGDEEYYDKSDDEGIVDNLCQDREFFGGIKV